VSPPAAHRAEAAWSRLRTAALRARIAATRRLAGRRIARLYHYELLYRTHNFGSTRWMGVPIWQNVLDLWTMQETIAELRPALVIEIGTHRGGSALFYAQLLELLGGGRVITVDVVDARECEHERIEFLHGSSTDPEIVERVRAAARAAEGPVMVILDGDHGRENVARELELYAPLVTEGSYLLSQDGVIDELAIFRDSRPGPLEANREFLRANPDFEHDAERNGRYGLSHHPLGWLRRVRS
jgi:cephalosporin hydroxylase